MSDLTTVARPYARAAFEFAVTANDIEAWSTMLLFASEVAQNATMAEVLTSDKAPQYIANLFLKVCDDQLDNNGQNFIKILAENGRLRVLPRVAQLYAELEYEHKKEINVDVISAYELSASQLTELSNSLQKRLSRKINLNCTVDETLIAGMVITAGDLVIDSSAVGQLNRLSITLQS